MTATGTFEHGDLSVLQRLAEPDDPERYERVRAALLEARGRRPQPGRDDKVVTAWNGLAVAALAEGGVLLDRPDWVAAAERCADLLRDLHTADGRLVRTSRDGVAGRTAGVLEDHADLAEGLLALHQATGDPERLAEAGRLLDVVLARFGDGAGGFYDTADDAERLVRRPQDPTDGPTPSGAAAAAGALLTYAAITGSARTARRPRRRWRGQAPLLGQHARFAGWAAAVGEAAARRAGRGRRARPSRPARGGPPGDLAGRGRGDRRAAGRGPRARRGVRLPRVVCELPTTDAGPAARAARASGRDSVLSRATL